MAIVRADNRVIGTPVRIAVVVATHQRANGRITYRVMLSCGCAYWEDREGFTASVVGSRAQCYARHERTSAPPPRDEII
jgi:hypothetical protein